MTEEVLRKMIRENNEINQSPEYLSDNVTENNIAYSQKQGFSDIRVMLLYTAVILISLGAGGGSCMIQTGMGGWKSFYNITFFQEYLLTVAGGYVCGLFILSLTMLVSARTRSAVLSVTVPFIILFVPSFLTSVNVLSKVLGMLPDQLLQISAGMNTFNLYELGGKVTGAIPVLFVLYLCLYLVMIPGTYRVYRKAEVK